MPETKRTSILGVPFSLFRKMMPTETSFVDAFVQQANLVHEGAAVFAGILSRTTDTETGHVALRVIEKNADAVNWKTLEQVRWVFLTPKGMDKDDIGDLSECMDDVVDLMKDAAKRIAWRGLQPPESFAKLGDCILRSADEIRIAIPLLSNIERNADALLAMRARVSKIESEADAIQNAAMKAVFSGEGSSGDKLLMENSYDLVEEVCDRFEDVSKLIARIVSKAV